MMDHEEEEEEMDDFINTSLGKSFITQKRSTSIGFWGGVCVAVYLTVAQRCEKGHLHQSHHLFHQHHS